MPTVPTANKDVAVILLAAGLGTRLAPMTHVLPKCLMPVRGRPLLEYWLRALDAAGLEDVLVNTHYLPHLVREWLAVSRWAGRVRLAHEPTLLGTAGTLLAQREFVGERPALLVHADNLCAADLGSFMDAHAGRVPGAVMTMMSFATDSPHSCGILELDGAGVVRAFHEKVADPPGNLANAAVYIVEPEVTEFIASLGRAVVDFSTEVIPRYLGRIQTWQNTSYHRDIGNVGSLLAAQAEYPAPGPLTPGEPDGWLGLCARDDGALPRSLARSLAQALKLPLAGSRDLPGGPVVLHAQDALALEATAADLDLAPGSVVAITDPVGASARLERILRERGYPWLTICSAPTSDHGEGTC